jgi:hypothetical protein
MTSEDKAIDRDAGSNDGAGVMNRLRLDRIAPPYEIPSPSSRHTPKRRERLQFNQDDFSPRPTMFERYIVMTFQARGMCEF